MTTPLKHRWFRFSLRTMFVLVTLVALALWQWNRVQRLEARAKRHQAAGIQLMVDFNMNDAATRDPQSHERRVEHDIEMHILCGQAKWMPWIEWFVLPPEK